MMDILNDWSSAKGALKKAAAGCRQEQAQEPAGRPRPSCSRRVLCPSAIYCAGANYTDHMMEMAKLQGIPPAPDPHEVGLKPWHFIKASRTVTGNKATVKLPKASNAIDWEAELGAVIGKKAKDVPLEKALDYVAGYTVANELSARDLGRRDQLPDATPFKWDWVGQKCFDDACPIGPWIVPASDIKDPQKLGIKLWVNDVIKQDSNTSDMIFNLAEQLSHLSSRITLYPGDIILTGTPAGVGAGAQGVPQGRRRGETLGREHRRDREPDGVNGRGRRPLTAWQGTSICPSRAVLVCVNSMGPDRRLSPVQTI